VPTRFGVAPIGPAIACTVFLNEDFKRRATFPRPLSLGCDIVKFARRVDRKHDEHRNVVDESPELPASCSVPRHTRQHSNELSAETVALATIHLDRLARDVYKPRLLQ
jgi:hypothetical protein